MKEIWKKIPGLEKYEASTLGKIRSFKAKKVLKTIIWKNYEKVTYEGNKYSVSRLILLTFIGPCPEGREASHLNDNSLDNRLCNLKWETWAENRLRMVIKNIKEFDFTNEEKIKLRTLHKQLGELLRGK